MKRLLIIQPYIPEYRVAFFRDLRSALSAEGFELVLAAGRAHGQLAKRGDDRTESNADVLLKSRPIGVGGKSLLLRDVRSVLHRFRPDLVIAEQAIKNVDVYPLLARQAITGRPRFGLWGQGRAFSTAQGKASRLLKQWVTRQSDWFFAYTQEGADYVIRYGFSPSRVSVLQNTVDTPQLRRDLDTVKQPDIEEFRLRNALVAGKTALFLGGVDTSKGIDFLLDSAQKVAERLPGFRLVVAGSGSSSDRVRQQQQEGACVAYVGRLEGPEKALALRAADVMLIPEWVGLVAVDSLVAGCPIVTTRHSSHSPEFAYIENCRNGFVLPHDVDAYAEGVASILRDKARLQEVRKQAIEDSVQYSLEQMVSRFSNGVTSWWATRSR